MESVKNSIIRLLAESLEKKIDDITLDMNLETDLEFDSFHLVDFVLRIEDEFHIEFTDFDDISHHMNTVGELVEFFEEYLRDL